MHHILPADQLLECWGLGKRCLWELRLLMALLATGREAAWCCLSLALMVMSEPLGHPWPTWGSEGRDTSLLPPTWRGRQEDQAGKAREEGRQDTKNMPS